MTRWVVAVVSWLTGASVCSAQFVSDEIHRWPISGVVERWVEVQSQDIPPAYRPSDEELRAQACDDLTRALRRFAKPALPEGDGLWCLGSHTLVGLLDPPQAASVGGLVEGWSKQVGQWVWIQKVRLFTISDPSWGLWKAEDGPERAASWSPVDAEPWVQSLKDSAKSHANCFVTIRPPGIGSMAVGQNHHCVVGYREQRVEGGASVVVPEIEEQFAGFRFRIQRVPLPDGLEGYGLEAERRELVQPIPTVAVTIAGEERSVHQPEWREARIETTVVAPEDKTTVLFGLHRDGMWTLVLVEQVRRRENS